MPLMLFSSSYNELALGIAEVVETREQFAVRQVEYAAKHFRQENVCPQRWQLVRRAGLRPDMEAVQQVKEAIAVALEPLFYI